MKRKPSGKTVETSAIRNRIHELVESICGGMYEREETVAVALLAALCGQNTFLYGPPGTAKSLISRRVACAFHQPAYFETLMNRFSTPEEVFGPISIKALKEDRYVRKTESYLPKADFAFLDEIWKASPAILNTLLTLINERVFKNGEVVEKAPLRALISASNETPELNQGLEALYDRFIVRLMVSPINQLHHFEQLLNSEPVSSEVDVSEHVQVGPEEWHAWLKEIPKVTLSAETMTIIHLIREKLAQQHEVLNIYVSDRRWQRAAVLMKAAAFFNGRTETNHSDALLLEHCIWTNQDNHRIVLEIVANAVKSVGFNSGFSLAEMDGKKESLDREINSELFHSTDLYKTETNAGGQELFKVNVPRNFYYAQHFGGVVSVFLPYRKMKSLDIQFHPLDRSGNEIKELLCKFDGQGTCDVMERRGGQTLIFKPEILFHRGDKKDNVNERLVSSMAESIFTIRSDLESILQRVTAKFTDIESKLSSIFVPVEKTTLAISGISEQIESLRLRIKDCERLEALCR